MKCTNIIDIVERQLMREEKNQVLWELSARHEYKTTYVALACFAYGVIEGKRAERAKRKRINKKSPAPDQRRQGENK